MSSNETPEHSPPRFCAEDGFALMQGTWSFLGRYDRFTGQRRPDEVVLELRCPNAIDSISSIEHDIWRLYSNRWIKI
jgi:hypothetical protein